MIKKQPNKYCMIKGSIGTVYSIKTPNAILKSGNFFKITITFRDKEVQPQAIIKSYLMSTRFIKDIGLFFELEKSYAAFMTEEFQIEEVKPLAGRVKLSYGKVVTKRINNMMIQASFIATLHSSQKTVNFVELCVLLSALSQWHFIKGSVPVNSYKQMKDILVKRIEFSI